MIKPIHNNVPPIFQPQGSNVCGPTSLYGILKYYGLDAGSYDAFTEQFTYESYGTYLPQLGLKALELGLSAEITMFNPHLFSVADMGSTNPIAAFEAAKQRYADDAKRQNGLAWFDKFHNAGGVTRVEIPTIQHITTALAQGALLIPLLATRFLIGDATYNFHFVISQA